MEPTTSTNTKGIIAGALALLLIGGGVFMAFRNKETEDITATSETTTSDTSTVPTATSSRYKDGTYTADGDYQSPGGAETIKITLVIEDDVITDAMAAAEATRPQSVTYQGMFVAGFKALVVGKNINDVNLTKVSGSSLTPKGFNDAVADIKLQAAL